MAETSKTETDNVSKYTLLTSGSDALRAEQVKVLFSQAPLGLLGTALCGLVVTYFLIGKTESTSLLIWCGALLLISILRYAQRCGLRSGLWYP